MSEAVPVEPVTIRCPRCRRHVDVTLITTSPNAVCPSCRGRFEAVRFEPPVRAALVPTTVEGMLEAAQPCAFHPRNGAVTSCQRCGSFMCGLCRIDVDNRTLCPPCFERLSSEGSLATTRTSFRDFPGLAGLSATAGCVLSFMGILLGPLAIYYAVKGLKQKKEMGESDGIVGLWVAIVLGGAEAAGGVFLIGYLLVRMVK